MLPRIERRVSGEDLERAQGACVPERALRIYSPMQARYRAPPVVRHFSPSPSPLYVGCMPPMRWQHRTPPLGEWCVGIPCPTGSYLPPCGGPKWGRGIHRCAAGRLGAVARPLARSAAQPSSRTLSQRTEYTIGLDGTSGVGHALARRFGARVNRTDDRPVSCSFARHRIAVIHRTSPIDGPRGCWGTTLLGKRSCQDRWSGRWFLELGRAVRWYASAPRDGPRSSRAAAP